MLLERAARGTPGHEPAEPGRPGRFTSSNTCRACHPAQYASWHTSYHRTMTQVAGPETVVADFDSVTVAHVHGRAMTLERRGREFWATFNDPDSVPAATTIATRSGAGVPTEPAGGSSGPDGCAHGIARASRDKS